MATEDILVQYRSDLSLLKAEFKESIALIQKTGDEAKKSADKTNKEFKSAAAGVRESAKEILNTLGIAFGTAAVIHFGKESVKAFLEAEENANKLRFAVTKIGGEGQAAFKKLLEQSEKLQKVSIFSDDDIQKAQTQLATLGLNSDQIEKLIPQILDLASATGSDLGSATDKIIQGINGQTRGLRAVGLEFEATGDKTKNLSILSEKLGKFQGATGEALETTAGKAKRLENAIDDIKESIGEFIVQGGNDFLDIIQAFSIGFDQAALKKANLTYKGIFKERNDLVLEDAKTSEQRRVELLRESIIRENDIVKKGQEERNQLKRRRILLELEAEKALQAELVKLNESPNNLGKGKVDDSAAKAALKLRQDTLNALTDLDIKADAEALAQLAHTEQEKLEIVRGAAIQEVLVAEKAAIDAGNKRIDAENITRNALFNINKKFDDAQAELEKAANKKEEEEALAFIDKLNSEVDAKEKEAIKKRKDQREKAAEELKRIEREIADTIIGSLSSISQINSNVTETRVQEVNEQADRELETVELSYKNRLITQEQYEQRKAQIDKKRAQEEAALRRKAFETNRQITLIQAIISTAQATVAALGTVPYTPANIALAAATAAAGALQVAVITSQPTPKFEKGGKVKGKRHIHGGTMVEAERDEWIINRNESIKNNDLLKAINAGSVEKYILSNYIAPALKAQKRKYEESKEGAFANNLAQSLILNSKGFKDDRLLESLKATRKNDREGFLYLAKVIEKTNGFNQRLW